MLPLLAVAGFALIAALQLFATVKGWQSARRLRPKTSPMAALSWRQRAIAVAGGLAGGILLGNASWRGR